VNDKSTADDVIRLLTRATATAAAAKLTKNLKLVPGGTALHILCRYYNHDNLIDLARPLFERGVDFNAQDSLGRNALHLLFQYYHQTKLLITMLDFFIDRVDVNAQTKTGWSPLHVLFRYYKYDNLLDLADLLITKKNIYLNARNLRGWTPLHHLCGYFYHKSLLNIVLLLKNYGADLGAKTVDGHSASYLLKTVIFDFEGKDRVIEMTQSKDENEYNDGFLNILTPVAHFMFGSTYDSLDDHESVFGVLINQ